MSGDLRRFLLSLGMTVVRLFISVYILRYLTYASDNRFIRLLDT